MSPTPEKRFHRGYSGKLNPDQMRQFRETFFGQSLLKGSLFSAVYVMSIYLCAAIVYFAIFGIHSKATAACLAVGAIVLAVRQMRALENIVHFGSHNNFSKRGRLNDVLVNILAAWPMLSDVHAYRNFHAMHHGKYGGHRDPCRIRFMNMDMTLATTATAGNLVGTVARQLPRYMQDFYVEVGSRGPQVLCFLLWHAVTLSAITLAAGPQMAIVTALFWLVCMFGLLPVVRFIAEAGEHDYDRADTEYATTYNNVGILDFVLFHPAGDAWHLLHHLYPTIPWWNQGAAHRFLMKNDPTYRAALHRKNVLQTGKEMQAAKPEKEYYPGLVGTANAIR